MTPTERSMKMLRAAGWHVEKVERWNPHARVRVDLWGFADLACLAPNRSGTVYVQVTTGANMAARMRKVEALPVALRCLRASNWIVVHGHRKVGPRGKRKLWECRVAEARVIEHYGQEPFIEWDIVET